MRERIRSLWRRLVDVVLEPVDPTRGRPDELLLSLVCIVSGVPTLLGRPPGSLGELLHPAAVLLWGVALVAFGSLLIGATFWQGDRIKAALVHRSASVALGLASAAYGVGVIAVGWPEAAFAGGIALGFAGARFIRAWQVHRWLQLRKAPSA